MFKKKIFGFIVIFGLTLFNVVRAQCDCQTLPATLVVNDSTPCCGELSFNYTNIRCGTCGSGCTMEYMERYKQNGNTYLSVWNTDPTSVDIPSMINACEPFTIQGCTRAVNCNGSVSETGVLPINPENCPSCDLTDARKTNETCNDNGSTADGTDDFISFSLNPTGTELGSSYNVSVNNGAVITPTSGTYGTVTNFRLQAGSADGTLYTITIEDGDDMNCTITATVRQNSCPSCDLTDARKTNESCNDNGTIADGDDDFISFSLNPTGTNLGSSYNVSVNNGAVISPTSGTYGSVANFRLQAGSADGTLYTITVTDNEDSNCFIRVTAQQTPCVSCPDPNCLGVMINVSSARE